METELKSAVRELANAVAELAQEVELLMEQNVGRVAIGQIGPTRIRIRDLRERIAQARERIEQA